MKEKLTKSEERAVQDILDAAEESKKVKGKNNAGNEDVIDSIDGSSNRVTVAQFIAQGANKILGARK